jgi:hypothetical protein
MAAYYLIAIAAGIASGLLHLSMALGSFGGLILVYLSPLPLFAVGLSMGALAALIAGGVGAVLGTLVIGFSLGASYLVMFALPVALLCRQALLWRRDAAGNQLWYPLGHLATLLAGLAALGFLTAAAASAIFGDGLLAELEQLMRDLAKIMQVEEHTDRLVAMAPVVPPTICVSWMLLITLNGALAQGALQYFKRNVRPGADIAEIRLPFLLLPAFVAAVLLAFLGGMPGFVGKTLAAIGAVPYFLAGLGAIHAWVRNWPGRMFVLALIYVLTFLLVWPCLGPIGLGVWRQLSGLRSGGADQEEE